MNTTEPPPDHQSAPAFTPGPWTIVPDTSTKSPFAKDWRGINSGRNQVVSVGSFDRHVLGETETYCGVRITEANAKLIAAAPELYAALKELIPAQDDFDTCAAALESRLQDPDGPSKKTREYFRNAKVRLLKAREAARAALTSAV